jgi:hypothetical protein
MARTGWLDLEGKKFEVIQYQFSISRNLDINARPNTSLLPATITLLMNEFMAGDFFAWFCGLASRKNGEITFDEPASRSEPRRKIQFTNGVCLEYKEIFDNGLQNKGAFISITISCEIVKVNKAPTHKKLWLRK